MIGHPLRYLSRALAGLLLMDQAKASLDQAAARQH